MGLYFMNIESLFPLFLILAVLVLAFALEAAVMAAFKLRKFWPSLGLSVWLNLTSFLLIYFLAKPFLSALGYDIGKASGLNLEFQVIGFLWWFSVVVEGLLLSLFLRKVERRRIFIAAIVMNLASFIFLYVFDVISH